MFEFFFFFFRNDSSIELPNFIRFLSSRIFVSTCTGKNRQVGGKGGEGRRDKLSRMKALLYRKFFSNETNSSTLEEDVRTIVEKSIRRRISRGRCDREQGGRWEGNKVAVCRSKCQISVAVSPFRASWSFSQPSTSLYCRHIPTTNFFSFSFSFFTNRAKSVSSNFP